MLLYGEQGGIDLDGDVVLLGVLDDVGPAGLFGQVEDVLHGVELYLVSVLPLALVDQLLLTRLKLVRGKFEED